MAVKRSSSLVSALSVFGRLKYLEERSKLGRSRFKDVVGWRGLDGSAGVSGELEALLMLARRRWRWNGTVAGQLLSSLVCGSKLDFALRIGPASSALGR